MGCDFYECVYLSIEWIEDNDDSECQSELIDNSTKTKYDSVLLGQTPIWFYASCDSDSEGAYDREMDKDMGKREQRYGHKLIYSDNEWKITSKESIERYSKYIPKNGKIIKMHKHLVCMDR